MKCLKALHTPMPVKLAAVASLVLLGLMLVSSCSKPTRLTARETREYNAVFAAARWTPSVQAKWARSCALCHVAGQGGAPRMGHHSDWVPRLKQGSDVLLKHTLDGFNKMPPLGYCMDCRMTDFAAMIDMMSGQSK